MGTMEIRFRYIGSKEVRANPQVCIGGASAPGVASNYVVAVGALMKVSQARKQSTSFLVPRDLNLYAEVFLTDCLRIQHPTHVVGLDGGISLGGDSTLVTNIQTHSTAGVSTVHVQAILQLLVVDRLSLTDCLYMITGRLLQRGNCDRR
jgi:hypothetical protein